MKKVIVRVAVAICALITFVVPLVQLSIGFQNIVKDGHDAKARCQLASDLPLLMAIGGIFSLFFHGTSYGFLKMLVSVGNHQSDIAGHAPRILIGTVSFIFGSITMIFFILIQMRVFKGYSNGVQFDNQQGANYCRPVIMRGALAMIILTYISAVLFIAIFVLLIARKQVKRREEKLHALKLLTADRNTRL